METPYVTHVCDYFKRAISRLLAADLDKSWTKQQSAFTVERLVFHSWKNLRT